MATRRFSRLVVLFVSLITVAAAGYAETTVLAGSQGVVRCPAIVFVKRHHCKRPFGIGTLLCWDVFRPGGGIFLYDPQRPEKGDRKIFDSRYGAVFDLSVSFDAKKILFAWQDLRQEANDSFHIYEIRIDGSGLRQITRGRYHDVHPFYLPDGRIGFVSTRVESFQMCQPGAASGLFVMQPDGTDIRQIEFGTLSDHSPYLLDDGSILFTRWEYQDKSLYTLQGLWTIHPDGTRLNLFFGNTLTNPNVIWQAKPIPGTKQMLCTLAPHHGNPVGAVGIVDHRAGLENPAALRNITPEYPYLPEVGGNRRLGDRQYNWAYRDPYPIDSHLFLVAYGGPVAGGPQRYRLFLLDDQGRKELLYEDPAISCFNPVPLVSRPPPHVSASHVDADKNSGAFFLLDVYRGLDGVPRGTVKELRIMSQVPKPCNMRGNRSPYDMDPIIGRSTFYVKYCYGTVPVAEDGSAYFEAPTGVELYFQALDGDGKEVCRMGSVTQVMPGETQSCIGCHESRSMAPPVRTTWAMALKTGPVKITPPPWGAGPVDFVRLVQPVLDRYCVRCHCGATPQGRLDLSGDKTRFFNMAYDNLMERNLVDYQWLQNAPTGNFRPLTTGSRVSKLTEYLENKHGEVDMDDESRRRIYTWIDANTPYYGTYEHTRPGTRGSRDAWSGPWYQAFETVYRENRCPSCHSPPRNSVEAGGKVWSWKKLVPAEWINLTHPEASRVLTAHLAKKAGGWGFRAPVNGKQPPHFQDVTDPVYQAMLRPIREGTKALEQKPRMDMPGAEPLPYPRDFGFRFYGFQGP